jgi:ATP-dependent Clp protease ATP-binding subunit ClpA
VQPGTAHPPVHDQGGLRTDDDARLGADLAAVVAGARRRAVRDGDRHTDTAHLLHSLLEHDAEVRAAVGGASQLVRLFGYLVQRSIGYGLRWQGSVEDAGALPVVPPPARHGGVPGDTTGWSPVAVAALEDAGRRARQRGATGVEGTDLLAALVADPHSRAVEVLERAGIAIGELRARIESRAPSD